MQDPIITLGGREWPVRLTGLDAIALQERFKYASMARWLIVDVLGVDPETGSRTSFKTVARVAVIAAAINRGAGKRGKTVATEVEVSGWWDDLGLAIKDGQVDVHAKQALLWTIAEMAYGSGLVTDDPTSVEEKLPQVKAYFFYGGDEEKSTPTAPVSEPKPSAVRAADSP